MYGTVEELEGGSCPEVWTSGAGLSVQTEFHPLRQRSCREFEFILTYFVLLLYFLKFEADSNNRS